MNILHEDNEEKYQLCKINGYILEYSCYGSTKLYSTKDNVTRETDINIWIPGACDYWFSYRIIDDNIFVFHDYYGIRLFNLDLKILFDLPVPELYEDVFGCDVDIEKKEVTIWLMNETQRISSELEKQDTTVFTGIILDDELIKLPRKVRREYDNRLIEFELRYKIYYYYNSRHYYGSCKEIQNCVKFIEEKKHFNVPLQCIKIYKF